MTQVTPPPVPPSSDKTAYSAYTNMTKAIHQLTNDRAAMLADYTSLITMVNHMKTMASSGNVQGALMYAFTAIFPQIFQYKQDNMVQLSDSQNVASGLRSYVNNIENDFNTGAAATTAQMTDLQHEVTGLKGWSEFLKTANASWTASGASLWTANSSPLDPNDANNIISAMGTNQNPVGSSAGIENSFTGSSGTVGSNDWGNASDMAKDMKRWFTAPSTNGGANDPASPAQNVKAIQGSIQTSNSAVSTLSTTVQTDEQFYTNEFNQITGIDNSIQQSEATMISSVVKNQIATS